ncbi:hypothetical protein [Martelella sp. HB161492]|uniref:hypothetical protein n=1 Tax=Martelella sp. HB161492 TaxID=2720726 RepID=UPI00159238C3|nr:hypothetical protein [Martelella sp. HB161492]
MTKNDTQLPLRDGIESLAEPVDLERILPGEKFRRPRTIKLTLPVALGGLLVAMTNDMQQK